MRRLELEYRQFYIYLFLGSIFYYLTGYFFVFIYLIAWMLAPLEELDPEEVESEEELWPFIELTYLETSWEKGNLKIKKEFENLDLQLKEKLTEKIRLNQTLLLSLESENLNPKLMVLNNINILKSIYV